MEDDAPVAPKTMRIAVIGAGTMGAPMALRLKDAGFPLIVCDRAQDNLAPLQAKGVETAMVPAACAECDVILILVATPKQLHKVVAGEHGLGAAGSGRRRRHVVVMSTVAPEDMHDLAAIFAGSRTRPVDAPISGGVIGAEQGTLTIMVGGADEDVAARVPIFEVLGTNVFHCGPLGAGQATKIVNNAIGIANIVLSAEAFRIGREYGIAHAALMRALDTGTGRNFFTAAPDIAPDAYAAWTRTPDEFASLWSIFRKDIDLALGIGGGGDPRPVLRALRGVLDRANDETFDNWKMVAIGDP